MILFSDHSVKLFVFFPPKDVLVAAELFLKKLLLCPLLWFLGFDAWCRLPAQSPESLCAAVFAQPGLIMDPDPGASRGENMSEQSCHAQWAAGLRC